MRTIFFHPLLVHGGDDVAGFLMGSNTVVSNKEPNPGTAALDGSFSAVVKSAHNRPKETNHNLRGCSSIYRTTLA